MAPKNSTHSPPLFSAGSTKPGSVALVLLLLLSACSKPPYPQSAAASEVEPRLLSLTINGRTLAYAQTTEGNHPIVFIHGTPGDWQAFREYLYDPQLASFGPLIAVDRPGWGKSPPPIMTNLEAQADLIAPLLKPNSVVVGHSLGGPIAAWLAIKYPEKICGAVLVAPSIAPELESMRWYNTLASWKILQPLIPDSLIAANREVEALPEELRKLEPTWKQLMRPIIVIQGMQDELVDPATSDYLEATVTDRWLKVRRFPDQGHFVLWETPQLVTDAITSLDCNESHGPVSWVSEHIVSLEDGRR